MNNNPPTRRNAAAFAPLAALLAAVALLAGPATTHADFSGAGLMLTPWEPGDHFEMEVDFFLQGRGRERDSSESVRINTFESTGRLRFDPDQPGSPALGYEVFHVSLNPRGNNLPQRLSDQSFAFGIGLAELGDWQVAATAGAGFAGNLPYSDRHAWYGHGNLLLSNQLDERTSIHFALNYDGNRSLFPDLPLPYFAYSHRPSDELVFVLGVPRSSVNWQPVPRFVLDVEYTLLYDLDLTATYELIERWLFVYGGFFNRFNAFHIKDDNPNRRVFFQQRRLEAGFRYGPGENWQAVAAAGYAFDQRLRRGWDVRDLDRVARFSDEPYLRLGFEVSF